VFYSFWCFFTDFPKLYFTDSNRRAVFTGSCFDV